MDVTTLMLYSAYDIMSTGPKGNSCHFAIFWRDGTCLRLYNLKILQLLGFFLDTWMSPDATIDLPFAKVSTDMLRTLPAFFGILMARPHERRSMMRVHGEDSGNRSKWNHYVHPWKTNIDTQNDEPWKRCLRLWRWPFLISMLNFWGVILLDFFSGMTPNGIFCLKLLSTLQSSGVSFFFSPPQKGKSLGEAVITRNWRMQMM